MLEEELLKCPFVIDKFARMNRCGGGVGPPWRCKNSIPSRHILSKWPSEAPCFPVHCLSEHARC